MGGERLLGVGQLIPEQDRKFYGRVPLPGQVRGRPLGESLREVPWLCHPRPRRQSAPGARIGGAF